MQARPAAMKTAVLVLALALSQAQAQAGNEDTAKGRKFVNDLISKKKEELSGNRQDKEENYTELTTNLAHTIEDMKGRISENNERIEMFNADSSEAQTKHDKAVAEIERLTKQMSNANADLKKSKADRARDAATFEKEIAELEASVSALSRAVGVMKRAPTKVAQAFVEISSAKLIPEASKNMVAAFLEGPDAYAYEGKSGGIVDMLETLLADFEKQLRDKREDDMNNKFAASMEQQDLVGEIDNCKAALQRQAAMRDEQKTNQGEADSNSSDETNLLETNKASLSKNTSDLAKAKSDMKSFRKENDSQMNTINKAAQAMNEQMFLQSNKKAFISLKGMSFLQMEVEGTSPHTAKAVAFLMKQANALHSDMLSQLSERMAEDPFVKVRKMIWDMINKLKKQAAEEAAHEGWCRKEMSVNKLKLSDFGNAVKKHTARSNALRGSIGDETNQIAELTQQKNADIKAKTDRQKLRLANQKKNDDHIDSTEQEKHTASKAQKILEKFSGGKGGIGGLSEIINKLVTDLDDDIRSTKALNKSQKDDARSDMQQFEQNVAVGAAAIENKKKLVSDLQEELQQSMTNLGESNKQLHSAELYRTKLNPSCVAKGMSHEERMAKRAAEIESLKDALDILESA
jgi:hypothetical protein